MVKICTKCKKELNISCFYKRKDAPLGIRSACKECYSKKAKDYFSKTGKEYYIQNKERIDRNNKKYRDNNKEKISKVNKEWKENNKDYKLKRYHEELEYRILDILRSRMRRALNGKSKSKHTIELIGCSVEELKIHLEKQFKEGMSWENYGYYGWHIDHIIPCASFDLLNEEEQKKCFHYTNLQPLWAKENLSKKRKY